ncbi:GntR family transcriptional regulator [Amycolatopsis rhabdoformis]|uniref:GntR family transcriptional regulator n=1 Tax=Amycolatopsis rhabdoformis TaxID=1448059 RepID=A0ABZ1IFW4_9PSEU|nr:GntR family transcriptional regulator [Amycolatopsis rhabdoformis]WSE32822.1 GntR family transcriptional regulator [Amycolatopsis rhabdoformis]
MARRKNPAVELPALALPPRTILRDSVYEALKAMLMDLDVAPGSRLSIDGIARRLAVSPTPVREALTKLESDGLVATRPNAGYIVAPVLDEARLEHLFDVRDLLEPEAARLAATGASKAQLADLRAACAAMSAHPAADDYHAYRDFAVLDARLHRVLAEASGNPLIADALARLHAHTHGYRLYFRVGIAATTTREHQAVVDAVAAHDGPAAQAAMRTHLARSRVRLRAAYEAGAGQSEVD